MNDESARARRRGQSRGTGDSAASSSRDTGGEERRRSEGGPNRRRGRDDQDPGAPRVAAAELLEQIRAGLAGADERLAAMTDASVARAEARERDATEATDRTDDKDLRSLGRKTVDDARAQARDASALGQLHREALALLTDDLERLIEQAGVREPREADRKRRRE